MAILLVQDCSERLFFGRWVRVVYVRWQRGMREIALWLRAILLTNVEHHCLFEATDIFEALVACKGSHLQVILASCFVQRCMPEASGRRHRGIATNNILSSQGHFFNANAWSFTNSFECCSSMLDLKHGVCYLLPQLWSIGMLTRVRGRAWFYESEVVRICTCILFAYMYLVHLCAHVHTTSLEEQFESHMTM